MTHKSQKISRLDFSCSMDVLFEGLWISTVNWNFYPTKYKFFSSYNFILFLVIKTLDPDPHWPKMLDPDPDLH
jgi:hypothetical protein